MIFRDRHDAGRQLADVLAERQLRSPAVLALPRGGVPVAYEVARRLDAPLDVFVARKIGAPGRPELAVGALAEGGEPIFDDRTLGFLGLDPADLAPTVEEERGELQRRVEAYRGGRELPDLSAHDIVLVDDGLATGSTARAALEALRRGSPRRLVLAIPVCAADSAARLRQVADDVVCVEAPKRFGSVGQWYADFTQTTDDTVMQLLERAMSTSS